MAGQLVRATVEFLRGHPPFDGMADSDLEFLAGGLQVAYYAKGEAILGPGDGEVSRLHIVKQGAVRSTGGGDAAASAAVGALRGEGECFPIGALLGRRASRYSYTADRDTFAYELDGPAFRELFERSAHFRRYCTDYLVSLADQSQRALRAQVSESLSDSEGMLSPLETLLAKPPVSCGPEISVRDALQMMRDQQVGSVVVTTPDGVPKGIFTRSDAVFRVMLPGLPLSTPIEEAMTRSPLALPADAPRFEAALLMTRHAIRHVVALRDGRLCGVVSERDLFALQRFSLGRIAQSIRNASSVPALQVAAGELRGAVRALVAHGLGAGQVTQAISSLNDLLVERATRFAAERYRVPSGWCWLALGSEGRSEQTLATDQDNALILPGEPDEPARRRWLDFAGEVNRSLEACGFPLCKGEIMARNPQWCLSLHEWKDVFLGWIRSPQPEALLNASIFFDFRPVAGDAAPAGELREVVVAEASRNRAFLRAMAGNALTTRPPIGFLRDFVTDDAPGFAGTLDLKKYGVRPIVDAARVWSLAKGSAATGTAARLQACVASGVLPAEEAGAAAAAFHFVQSLRIRRQFLGEAPHAGFENRIRPGELNELDRRVLRESFRQAAKMQERLRMDYTL